MQAVTGSVAGLPEIRFVFGQGANDRWEDFSKLILTHREPLYGSQEKLLKDVKQIDSLKSRLLFDKEEKPVGVLIYSTHLTSNDSFEITSLFALDQLDPSSDMPLTTKLFLHAMEEAKYLRARSITLNVSARDASLEKFARTQNFLRHFGSIHMLSKTFILGLETSNKRERESDSSTVVAVTSGERDRPDTDDTALAEMKFRRAENAPYSSQRVERFNPPTSSSSAAAATPPTGSRFSRTTKCTLKQPYLGQIQRGLKTVEGRINTGMFRNIKAGEMIEFFNHNAKVLCKIVKINRYASFEEMLTQEGVAPCLPNTSSLSEGVRIYDNIPGYNERAKQFGVLAIHLSLV